MGHVVEDCDCCGGGVSTCCCPDVVPRNLLGEITVGPPCNDTYDFRMVYDEGSTPELPCWEGERSVDCGLLLCNQQRTVKFVLCCTEAGGCVWILSASCDDFVTTATGTLISESCDPFELSFSISAGAGGCTSCPAFIIGFTEL